MNGIVLAIGSAPEIGLVFHSFGELPPDKQQLWFDRIREGYGPDGLAGYASVQFVAKYVGRVPPLAVGQGAKFFAEQVVIEDSNG